MNYEKIITIVLQVAQLKNM